MLPVALEQVKPKHLTAHWVMWRARQTLGDDVKAEALLDTLADTMAQAEVKTLATN